MNQHFINFLIIKVRFAGGAPAQSGCFQHQQLRLSYVCTSATAAFAFDAFDAYGVSGFTRLCRSASSPSQHSFCTLLRRSNLGRRFILSTINYNFLYSYFFTHLLIILTTFELVTEFEFGFLSAVQIDKTFRHKDHFTGKTFFEFLDLIEHFRSRLAR